MTEQHRKRSLGLIEEATARLGAVLLGILLAIVAIGVGTTHDPNDRDKPVRKDISESRFEKLSEASFRLSLILIFVLFVFWAFVSFLLGAE